MVGYEAVVQRKLGIIPTAWKYYRWSFNEIDPPCQCVEMVVVENHKKLKGEMGI